MLRENKVLYVSELLPQSDLVQESSSAVSSSSSWWGQRWWWTSRGRRRWRWKMCGLGRWQWRGWRRRRTPSTATCTSAGCRWHRWRWEAHRALLDRWWRGRSLVEGGGMKGLRWWRWLEIRGVCWWRWWQRTASACWRRWGWQASSRWRWLRGRVPSWRMAWDRRQGAGATSRRRRNGRGSRYRGQRTVSAWWRWRGCRACDAMAQNNARACNIIKMSTKSGANFLGEENGKTSNILHWSKDMSDTSGRPEWCIVGLTSVHLPFHSLHASWLLDDIVDELGGFLIPHLIFADSSLGQQLPQVRVQVVGVKADMWDVSDG